MGPDIIMIVRHAEKPDAYGAVGTQYYGVDPTGSIAGNPAGDKHLITQGWQRAGALVSLFAPGLGKGTVAPPLAVPKFLFAADPGDMKETDGKGPSKRPAETLSAVASVLGLTVNTDFADTDYHHMVKTALTCDGPVLIAWQHEDIPLLNKAKDPGMSQSILDHTKTPAAQAAQLNIPKSWPHGPLWTGGPAEARYDLVFVFQRDAANTGFITGFSIQAQRLLAGDAAAPD